MFSLRNLPYLVSPFVLAMTLACNQAAPEQVSAPVTTSGEEESARPEAAPEPVESDAMTIYDFELETIDGKKTTLAEHRGKVMLIVNVASECGFTYQYEGLQALWQEKQGEGLVVLGFPTNDFGGQEPGTNEEIAAFCTGKFAVDFPMYAKLSAKGEKQSPLYAHLTEATGEEVGWNFNKFLVDREGKVVKRFDSKVKPDDEAFRAAIDALL